MTFMQESLVIDICFLIKKNPSKQSVKIVLPEGNERLSVWGADLEKYYGYYEDSIPYFINLAINYTSDSIINTNSSGMRGVPVFCDILTYKGDPWGFRFYHFKNFAAISLVTPISYTNFITGQIIIPRKKQ